MVVARLLRPFFLSLTAFSVFPFVNSITESETLLKFKQSLSNAKSLDSWSSDSDPCGQDLRWVGLLCRKDVVFGIQLEGMSLSGNIDVVSLAGLPGLRTISIMNNSFTGTIPQFNRLVDLKSVYLTGNGFSGTIPPDYFTHMASLKKVWLSNNKFSGPIPQSLGTLPNLKELQLDNNEFDGPIPEFSQSDLVHIDFHNNRLTGKIPPGLSKFEPRVFEGNPGLCGEKLGSSCPEEGQSKSRFVTEGSMRNAAKIKYVIAFGTLGSLILIILATIVFKKKEVKTNNVDDQSSDSGQDNSDCHVQVTVARSRSNSENSIAGRKSGGATELVMVNTEKGVFGLPDLMKAAAEVLGDCGGDPTSNISGSGSSRMVGSTYKAVMGNGMVVVVKRVTVMTKVTREVFDKEIRRLGSLRHKNLLTPLAYHYRRDEKLLVFEFVPNSSLLHRLHGDHSELGLQLDWPSRRKIIRGITRGMAYLHRELGFLILPHGNLKSSNILLSHDGEPLISEFGFHRLINPDAQIQSLIAYKSCEAEQTGIVSVKSDVFCLGVVILEILTGKFPSQYAGLERVDGADVVEWVRSAVENGVWMELLHPIVVAAATVGQKALEEIEKILRIGVRCTGEDPDGRPDIIEIVNEIECKDPNDELITIRDG